MSQISDAVAALQTQVTQQTTVEQSAITLIQGIVAQLQAALDNAKDDGAAVAAVEALTAQLQTSASALSTAVSAVPPQPAPSPSQS